MNQELTLSSSCTFITDNYAATKQLLGVPLYFVNNLSLKLHKKNNVTAY